LQAALVCDIGNTAQTIENQEEKWYNKNMNRQLTFLMINDELAKTDRQIEYYVCTRKTLSG